MTDKPPLPISDQGQWGGTESVGEGRSQAEGRVFPCPRCGADVVFHIGSQKLHCPYCGYEQELTIAEGAEIQERDYEQELARLEEFREQELSETSGLKEVHCDACNGDVVFEGSLTSTHCPYCASPIQLDQIHELEIRIRPDAVLPFQIDERQARHAIAMWVKSVWFAPNDFKKQGAKGELNGVYLPYWTFDSMTANAYRGERGENYTVTVGSGKNRRTETRTRWYPASGAFQRFFDDVLVLGVNRMTLKLVQGLEPWPLHLMIPFNREVLAGYLARTYEIRLDEGFSQARLRMNAEIRMEVERRIGGDRQIVHDIQTKHAAMTFKYVMLPIWLLSYRYGENVYQVMINAGTGRVAGEYPKSPWKIALAVLSVAAVCGLVWWLIQR